MQIAIGFRRKAGHQRKALARLLRVPPTTTAAAAAAGKRLPSADVFNRADANVLLSVDGLAEPVRFGGAVGGAVALDDELGRGQHLDDLLAADGEVHGAASHAADHGAAAVGAATTGGGAGAAGRGASVGTGARGNGGLTTVALLGGGGGPPAALVFGTAEGLGTDAAAPPPRFGGSSGRGCRQQTPGGRARGGAYFAEIATPWV